MAIFTIIIAVAAFAMGTYELFSAFNDPTAPYAAGKKLKKNRTRAFIVDIVLAVIMYAIAVLTLLIGFGVIG